MLAHTAAHEGIVAAHVIAGEKDVHEIDYVKQPRATYCRPEIASIGLTQQQAEEQGLPIKIGKVPFQAIAKAIIVGEYEGFAKIIGNKETDETLGDPHHRAARDRPDRGGVGRLRAGGDAVGDRRLDPRPPNATRRSWARRRWPSTADRSTSEPTAEELMAVDIPREQGEPPRRRRRAVRRRPARDVPPRRPCPCRRRADVDPQSGGPDSVRDLRARDTRAPRSGSPGRSRRGRTGSPRSTARSRRA